MLYCYLTKIYMHVRPIQYMSHNWDNGVEDGLVLASLELFIIS